jgi:hypothetical protein
MPRSDSESFRRRNDRSKRGGVRLRMRPSAWTPARQRMIGSPYPRCVSGPRRALTADAGRPTRQAPARTSETLQGSPIPESRPISMRRGPGIQPLLTIPSRLSFRAGFSRGYHRLRNTGFTRSTRSEITRRTEKEQAFIRSMTA